MGFFGSIKTCYVKMVVWKGRASRAEYWWFFLYQILMSLVLLGLYALAIYYVILTNPEWFNAVLAAEGKPEAMPVMAPDIPGELWMWVVIPNVASLFLFGLPNLAVFVRRLHDSGHSGWWYWIALVPIIGIIILFVFLLLPSDEGHNRFGPPPGGERPFMPIGYDTKALRKAQKAARASTPAAIMQRTTPEDEFREYYRRKVEPAIKRTKPSMG